MDEKIKQLSEPFPDEAIQKTSGRETKKGYDTTGYGYQYCVDRFNEVLGLNWGYEYDIVNHERGQYNNGVSYHDITVNLGIWIESKENIRYCAGGHISKTFSDAYKGAITNAFKKTSAFWQVGAAAYRGTIDADNQPYPDVAENKKQLPNGNYDEILNKITQAATIEELTGIGNLISTYSWDTKELETLRKKYAEKKSNLVESIFTNEGAK